MRPFRLFLFVFWLLTFVRSGSAAGTSDSFAAVQETLEQCQAAYHRLVDYRGTLRRETWEGGPALRIDEIDVMFRKPAFLSLRWQAGLYRGTELLTRPAGS